MNRIRTYFIIPMIIILTAGLGIKGDLYAAPDSAQKDQMKRDIEVLERILDQLIIHDSPYLFSGSEKVSGIYLDGFGIMFDFESSGLLSLADMIHYNVSRMPKIRVSSEDDDYIIKVETDNDEEEQEIDVKAEIEKSLKQTEDLIYEFFINYATTVKSLEDDEWICINIRNSKGFLVDEGEDEMVPSQLRACVSAKDLGDYRRGKAKESKLRSQIDIDRMYGHDKYRDLTILEKIIDQALDRKSGSRFIDLDGNTRSMYLDGYGAIFFSPVSAFERFEHVIVRNAKNLEKKIAKMEAQIRKEEERVREHEADVREHAERVREYERQIREMEREKRENESETTVPAPPAPPAPAVSEYDFDFRFVGGPELTEKQVDSVLTSISDKIIDVLGQYGPTLKSVRNNESVLVAVDLEKGLLDSGEDALYLKVSKADIDRYAREEISFDQLKKSTKIWRD